MKRTERWWRGLVVTAVLVGVLITAAPALGLTLTGAGATFPQPLYSKWAKDYNAATKVRVNYSGVGSGTGIAQIKAGTVNFGASDKPSTPADLNSWGIAQFPSCVGGVVPIIHLTDRAGNRIGNGRLKLTGSVLSLIYRGKITKWSDSRITSLNRGLRLPSSRIRVFHRSDASGTSWIFTHYLKAVDSAFPFADMNGAWPVGTGARGNQGVANGVKTNSGAIGYVEYAYSIQARTPYVQLKNKAGHWVLPSLGTFAAAASHATWSAKAAFVTNLVNMRGTTSWPITGATYILVRKAQKSYSLGHGVLAFFNWGLTKAKGKTDARVLQYVSLPSGAVKKIKASWHTSIRAGSKPCW